MTRTLGSIAFVVPLLLARVACAEVTDVATDHLAIRHQERVAAPPEKVYQTLVAIGSWWSGEHTYSGDARNLTLDARPGGCFCERLANGGGVEHLRVIYVAPNEILRMSGALGPLQSGALTGTMTFTLAPDGTGTKLTMSYETSGFIDGGLVKLGPLVDSVLAMQYGRLKFVAETGQPVAGAQGDKR